MEKRNKQVGITQKAHKALENLVAKSRKDGIPATRGGIASELIINAEKKLCQG
jgi:hypothetical protein